MHWKYFTWNYFSAYDVRSKYNRPNSLTLVLKWMSLVYNTLHCCWILMFRIAAAWDVHCSGMWCSVDL